MPRLQVWFSLCALLSAAALWRLARAADDSPARPSEAIAALREALDSNQQYCAQTVKDRDYKSLAKGTTGLQVLIEVLRCKGDDPPWRTAIERIETANKALDTAAKKGDTPGSTAAVAQLKESVSALSSLEPAGKAVPPRKSTVGLRNLMYLLSGTQGEGSAAISLGEPKSAKNMARVLSELGPVVFNERTDSRWAKLSDDFVAASKVAADSPATDSATLRQLFKQIDKSCEACHQRR